MKERLIREMPKTARIETTPQERAEFAESERENKPVGFFGEEVIKQENLLLELRSNGLQSLEKTAQRVLVKKIKECQEQIRELFGKGNTANAIDAVHAMFSSYLTDTYPEPDKLFNATGIGGMDANEIAHFWIEDIIGNEPWDRVMSKEMFLNIIKHHAGAMREKTEAMKEEFESYRARFLADLARWVEEKKIPIDLAEAAKIMASVDVAVVDELSSMLAERDGDYVPETHRIRLGASLPQGEQYVVFVHEAFHALGGRSERLEIKTYGEDDARAEFTEHKIAKLGLRFTSGDEKIIGKRGAPDRRPSMWWLDEACTERATMDALKLKNGAYRDERALLEKIVGRGIDMQTFYAAYFEHYKVPGAGEHPTPAMKRLFDETNKKIQMGFLAELNIYIQYLERKEEGGDAKGAATKKALAKWRELGDSFPVFIMAQAEKIRKQNL